MVLKMSNFEKELSSTEPT